MLTTQCDDLREGEPESMDFAVLPFKASWNLIVLFVFQPLDAKG